MRRLIHTLDASGRFTPPRGELSIAVLDADTMGRVHADFLGDPAPTDVITFPGDALAASAGEICVCADVARDYVRASGGDFARELALYVVHGYLHLCGFDDTTAVASRRMRRAEAVALAVLDEAGSIPAFRWKRSASRR